MVKRNAGSATVSAMDASLPSSSARAEARRARLGVGEVIGFKTELIAPQKSFFNWSIGEIEPWKGRGETLSGSKRNMGP